MPDEGYFPRGRSVLRRVHGERMVGLHYGQRALLIGAADPRNYVGTALSTARPETPFARLAHTAKVFETVYFGTCTEADEVLERVARLHARVRGVLPADAGPHPAGTPYAADDPELALWTLAVHADSGRALYEALVGPLSAHELDALWRDYVRFGELFGLAPRDAPASWSDFSEYWEDRLHSGTLYLTEGARRAGLQSAFAIPVPLHMRPGMPVANLLIAGTVPEPIRELYGLRWDAAHEAAFRAVTASIRRSHRLLPHAMRRGSCTRVFDAVTAAERASIATGRSFAVGP
ncbi:MAG TPA: oxygenase MpaB family protein [Solirubrobacteraceae bacterium]